MYSRTTDITGRKFHKLTAIRRAGVIGRNALWLFRCECGNEKILSARNVKVKVRPTTSCGCATGYEDLTGRRYGKLEVLERVCNDSSRNARWLCRCDCGIKTTASGSVLRSGKKSCVCLRGEPHGETHPETVEYRAWCAMIGRCHNPNVPQFKHYGGRGIRVSDEWRESYLAFLAHVGRRPSDKHSIDRINNDGNYEAGNVQWATRDVQNNNTRSNVWIEYGGKRMTAAQWDRELGFAGGTVACRIISGMSVERALSRTYRRQAPRGSIMLKVVKRRKAKLPISQN